MAEAVLAACRDAGLKLATAESCTGGLISGCLTAVAGSSDVVDRGFVTYTNEAKSQLLDAIESLSAGFALFDRDDRLVVCNTKFRSAFLVIATHIKRGAKFEDIVRRYAETVES